MWILLFQMIVVLVCGRGSKGGGDIEQEESVQAGSADMLHILLRHLGRGMSSRSAVSSKWWERTWCRWMRKVRKLLLSGFHTLRKHQDVGH